MTSERERERENARERKKADCKRAIRNRKRDCERESLGYGESERE